MLHKLKKFNKKIPFLIGLMSISFLAAQPAEAKIIFKNEFLIEDNGSNAFILDARDNVTGDLSLQFGNTLAESITFDTGNDWFEFSNDVSLNDNRLISAEIENVSALPGGGVGLGAGGTGRFVFLTTLDSTAPGCTSSPNCAAGGYLWNGTIWEKAGDSGSSSSFQQTVTVAKSGGQYTSVKSAVDSIVDATALKRYVITVYPGIYAEAPITVPDYVSIRGIGGLSNVIISATTPTGTLIDAGANSQIENMSLTGASGAGGICLQADGNTLLTLIQLSNCETGILATGTSAFVRALSIGATSGTFTDIIKYTAGATGSVTQYGVTGSTAANNAFVASGSGTQVAIANTNMRAAGITNGIYVNDSARAEVGNVTIQLADYGLRIGSTGSSVVDGSGGRITDNEIYNIFSESTTSSIYYTGLVMNKNKLSIPAAMTNVISFNDDTLDDEALNIFGELNMGRPEEGQEALFGEGDSYTDGLLVYTYNGVSYTDVSTAAKSSSGSTFSFPSTSVNDAIYISSNRKDSLGNFVKFGGYRYLTAGTAALGGTIVHEYWNGSAWIAFNVMCLHSTLLYRYDETCHRRANSNEYALFDHTIRTNWTLNDPPSTGTNRYWVRIRISTGLTSAPLFEQFKINPNSVQVNRDGTFTFLGNSRYRKTFITGPEMLLFGQGSNAPGSASITVGTGGTSFILERAISAFIGTGTTIEEVTGSFALPRGIDTSSPVTVRIYWKKLNNAAGNVQWKIAYAVAGALNVPAVDGSNIATAPRSTAESIAAVTVNTIETTPIGTGFTGNEIVLSEFTLPIDISGYYEGDPIYLRLYRDPADVDDTYANDALMVGFEMSGIFWTLGEKL